MMWHESISVFLADPVNDDVARVNLAQRGVATDVACTGKHARGREHAWHGRRRLGEACNICICALIYPFNCFTFELKCSYSKLTKRFIEQKPLL